MANPKNRAAIAQLRELIGTAPSFFLVDYQGLSAGELNVLRARVRSAGGRLLVAKNTLIEVVLKERGLEGFHEALVGPSALILVGDDVVAPVKALSEYASDHPRSLPSSKGGYMQGSVVGPAALAKIARLPARDAILSELVGVLSSPLVQLVGALASPQRRLVTVLDNFVDKQKEA